MTWKYWELASDFDLDAPLGWYVGPTVAVEGTLPTEVIRNIRRRMADIGRNQICSGQGGRD
jgi:hypothetical protein